MRERIEALVDAIDRQDDVAAKRHSIGLAAEVADLLERGVKALEKIAHNTEPVVITGELDPEVVLQPHMRR